MKKLDVVMYTSIVISVLGIICFWVFAINRAETYAAYSLYTAGVCGYLFLGCLWLHHRRQSWMV